MKPGNVLTSGPEIRTAWCRSREKIGLVRDPLAHIWQVSQSLSAKTLCGRLVAAGPGEVNASRFNRCVVCTWRSRRLTG